jgi:hypothetical protein
MKNIFSRKHDTQTGSSKYRFWLSGERSAPKPVPSQTDNTRIQADIQPSSRAASATNLQPSAAEDKPTVSVSTAGPSTEKTIYPSTRTYTVPQANFHPRPSSSRHRDYHDEPPRAGHPSTLSHEREDRAKGFRHVPSRNELAPKNQTELWPPPPSSKQPGPLDDRYREHPVHEDTERRRYRDEDKPDPRYGIRMETPKAKWSREGDEDRFRVSRNQPREEYGTIRERHPTSQRPRDKDRAMESEPEGIREREKLKVRQKDRERHQREFEKERERQKVERQQREYERERERVKHQEMENERERERQNDERERQRELEKQREDKERQRQIEERERERQRQKEERQREKQRELDNEKEKEKEKEKETERQKEVEREKQKEIEKEREIQKELERERVREEKERERRIELERERERDHQRVLDKEERERQKELEREKQREFV